MRRQPLAYYYCLVVVVQCRQMLRCCSHVIQSQDRHIAATVFILQVAVCIYIDIDIDIFTI